MSQPHRHDPPPPWRRTGEEMALRVVGGILVAAGAVMAVTAGTVSSLEGWPAWVMLASGVYLVARG